MFKNGVQSQLVRFPAVGTLDAVDVRAHVNPPHSFENVLQAKQVTHERAVANRHVNRVKHLKCRFLFGLGHRGNENRHEVFIKPRLRYSLHVKVESAYFEIM